MISYLLAMDENRIIGKNNDLPWRLPNDLKFFKRLTMGHTIVMGRKTLESFKKPLPGRRNVVLTKNKDYYPAGCDIFHSVDAILDMDSPNREIFVIGGSQIFNAFFPYVDRLYITLIEHSFAGDTYFEGFDESEWELVSDRKGIVDEKNRYPHRFLIYDRRK
ncbi:dihydrofolate reductase [Scopulibacillus darangshiensis]|uniref:Dihydrofolate reductase n=1 Tax=Scopulibacillus darangshiensis TaxID=442528 RepID=A0A4R2NYA2_9BACL|nr:dihydrofolate reductase [Scopulibacillus darangshiensis]TCP27062.1 dihydrofolate reductase [Scopulibacillus darangshiensis]